MEWIRKHPYISALCAAGVLLFFGVFIVEQQAATPSPSQPSSWSDTGAPLFNPISPAASAAPATGTQNQQNITQQVQNAAPYTYIPPADVTVASTDVGTNSGDSFDFNAFMASLSQTSAPAKPAPASTNSSLNSAYSFIPSGLVSTTTPQNKRTKEQQDLYDYGNELGSYVQSFEQQNPGEAQTLTNQIQDRTDASKIAAVEALGQALQNVGASMSRMDTVPAQMGAMHTALAQSYIEIGTKLALVPQAQRDSDFVAAIQAYDTAADNFMKNYVAVAQLFSAYGVTFASDDPGSVFTFTPKTL